MVMRARDLVYHLNCFACSTCAKMLTTGDHFGMKDSLVYCRLHFEALLQGEYQLHFNHAEGAAGKGIPAALGASAALGLPYYNGVGTVQKGRPRKRKSPGPGTDLAAYNTGEGHGRKWRRVPRLRGCDPGCRLAGGGTGVPCGASHLRFFLGGALALGRAFGGSQELGISAFCVPPG
ncbi:LIM/homeobox protein Lhx2-like [Hemicordylus capensis]|uniref:LIM/homeobox protein Lhx2-like n=1 Tax=Hemicordylus capensis TaxID=884348 RepID=UPI002303E45D|nr:LIM/homeobox protein Lhx2-like [Hemicordylus capensis]